MKIRDRKWWKRNADNGEFEEHWNGTIPGIKNCTISICLLFF